MNTQQGAWTVYLIIEKQRMMKSAMRRRNLLEPYKKLNGGPLSLKADPALSGLVGWHRAYVSQLRPFILKRRFYLGGYSYEKNA